MFNCRILPTGNSLGFNFNKMTPASYITLSCVERKNSIDSNMKPAIVADEMFPEGAGPYMDFEEAGGSSGLLMDLAANEKAVHADFVNDFEDLFDDDNLD